MGIGKQLAEVEETLEKAVASDVEPLSKASKHIIRGGGKRLRPRVVLLSYLAAGGRDASSAVSLAAAVELLHTASLVHDDINDQSDMRRGRATVNAQWGDRVALLAGDFMFIRLLSLIAPFGRRVIQTLADCCTAIVEGETLQMLGVTHDEMTEELYLNTIRLKTASLFSAGAELGGMLAEGTEQQIAALRSYGVNLGMAFQIRDDTLDLVGKREALGKPVALDLEQGKMSLATLFALRTSEGAKEVLSSKNPAQVMDLLQQSGALEYAMQRARDYSNWGKDALSTMPPSQAIAELTELADFAVRRDR